MQPVILQNRGTDQITLELPVMEAGSGDTPKRDARGAPVFKEFLLGSQEDVGNPDAPQPELEVTPDEWARLKTQPAIAGMVREGKISVFRAGAEV